MPTETAETAVQEEWVRLPSNVCVSAKRMQRNGKSFTLYEASVMDVDGFNKEAKQYGVRIEPMDYPIDRLVKYSIFLSRRDKDGSAMLTNREYTDMVLEVAAAKTRSPFDSLYRMLTTGLVDATRDVLEFHGRVRDGPDKGKHEARLLRFDEEGRLQLLDEILVAPEGWITALGAKHGYPIETGGPQCRVHNLDIRGVEDNDASGYWSVGTEPPNTGERRIVLRDPRWDGDGLLNANVSGDWSCSDGGVGALRSRRELPAGCVAESEKAHSEARRLRAVLAEVAEVQKNMRDLLAMNC